MYNLRSLLFLSCTNHCCPLAPPRPWERLTGLGTQQSTSGGNATICRPALRQGGEERKKSDFSFLSSSAETMTFAMVVTQHNQPVGARRYRQYTCFGKDEDRGEDERKARHPSSPCLQTLQPLQQKRRGDGGCRRARTYGLRIRGQRNGCRRHEGGPPRPSRRPVWSRRRRNGPRR